MKLKLKTATGAINTAVVNDATLNKEHRDFLPKKVFETNWGER